MYNPAVAPYVHKGIKTTKGRGNPGLLYLHGGFWFGSLKKI